MATAVSAIANDGVYIEPTFYTTIESSNGKNILRSKQNSHRVFSKATCYVLTELLSQPIYGTYGTATYCSLDGIDVAAKTGTTNDNYDKYKNEILEYAGKNKDAVGSVFELADFFLAKQKDIAMHRVLFQIPSAEYKQRQKRRTGES